jgi:hypothetical protein
MMPGGCDKTQQMIGEWERKIAPLKEEHGAGEVGSDEVVRKYTKLTPGQVLNTIKQVIRGKYKKSRSLI